MCTHATIRLHYFCLEQWWCEIARGRYLEEYSRRTCPEPWGKSLKAKYRNQQLNPRGVCSVEHAYRFLHFEPKPLLIAIWFIYWHITKQAYQRHHLLCHTSAASTIRYKKKKKTIVASILYSRRKRYVRPFNNGTSSGGSKHQVRPINNTPPYGGRGGHLYAYENFNIDLFSCYSLRSSDLSPSKSR